MKKLLGILMILILIAGVFVSCSQDKIEEAAISGEELLDVSFDASSRITRDLSVDTPTFDDGDYVWYYTAKKDDTSGFNTGETTAKKPVKGTYETLADRQGLAGAVISGLSQGYWDFGLYAYTPDTSKAVDYDYSSGSVAWQGSVSHFLLVKGAANVVDVTVSPSTQGEGWLVVDIDNIYVKDANGNTVPITSTTGTSLAYTVTPVGGTASVDISEPIDAGAYVVKVVCTGSNIDYAEDTIVVNVYSGLTRTVSGWIGELTTSATFGNITGEIIEASTDKIDQDYLDNLLPTDSVEFTSDEGTVPVTASLPVTAAQTLLDSVTTEGASTDLMLTLNVKADTESTQEEVTTKAYNIDLIQKVVTTTESTSTTTVSNVTDVLSDYLTATLTIDKNLSYVHVTHGVSPKLDMVDLGNASVPTAEQIAADAAAGYPGFYKYNAATGELKLMTMKFSPFEVSYKKPVEGVAAVYHGSVEEENLVASCKSLADAIELAIDGDVVKVLQSTSYGSDAKISKAIKVDVSDENVSVVDITSPEEAIALAGRGYKGTYADDVLTITKTPITDAVARIDEGDVKLYFNTLQEAIDAALDGETVYLLCNENLLEVEVNGKVLINKSITFDGNGYTISRKGKSHLPGFALHVNGSEDNYINVVIQNLKIDTERSHGVIFNTYIDQAVMTDCSIDTKYRTPIYTGDDPPVSSVRKVILNNVSATMHEPEDRSYPWNNTALAVTYGATVIVNGGTYTAPISTYVMNSGGSLTIDGDAEFVATGNSTYSLEGIRLDRDQNQGPWSCDSILTIKGGTFDFTQATAPGINLYNSGDVSHVGWDDQVKLVIEGGTFIGFAVNGVDDNWCIATITGGTFDHDPSAYVPAGYIVTQAGGWYKVSPLTLVKAVDATCSTTGTHTYWKDSDENKYIVDEYNNTIRVATEADLIIPAHHAYVFDSYTTDDCDAGYCKAKFICLNCEEEDEGHVKEEIRPLVIVESDIEIYGFIKSDSFVDGSVIQLKVPAVTKYETSDSNEVRKSFVLVGDPEGGSVLYVKNNRGFKLWNRQAPLVEKTWHFANLVIDGSQWTGNWGHLVLFTGQKAEIGFNNVAVRNFAGNGTSIFGLWENQPYGEYEGKVYPAKSVSPDTYVNIKNLTVESTASTKPLIQIQSYETWAMQGDNSDSYEGVHIAYSAAEEDFINNQIHIQSGQRFHDGVHNEWFLNGQIMEGIPGTDGTYGEIEL